MRDKPTLDRRSFLELVGASGAAVATGAVAVGAAAGCQGGPTPAPNGTPPAPADEPKPASADELGVAGPVRLAVVSDDVVPAFTFRPLGRSS